MSAGQKAYGREVQLSADLGVFHVEGWADFVLVLWNDGKPRLRIVECKANCRDHTYHRVQVALYGMIVRRMLQDDYPRPQPFQRRVLPSSGEAHSRLLRGPPGPHRSGEVEHYQSAMLWKSLRALCSHLVTSETIGGYTVRVYTPPVGPGAGSSG